MTHYICTGRCKAISDNPGICQASDCEKQNHELETCECHDGRHHGKQDHHEPKGESASENY